jgi:hypothetical protein
MCKRFILTIGAKQGRGFLHDGAEGTKAPASSLEIKKSAQIKFFSLSSSLRIIFGRRKGRLRCQTRQQTMQMPMQVVIHITGIATQRTARATWSAFSTDLKKWNSTFHTRSFVSVKVKTGRSTGSS